MGIALKTTDVIPRWYAMCYGFCPTVNLTLPPNSPTMHITDLLKCKAVSPLQKGSLRRCGSPPCCDLFGWGSEL